MALRIRKPNRMSGPVRVTQRGTKTAYPQPNYAALRRRRKWNARWNRG